MNNFLVLLVVICSIRVFSVGGANSKYRQVKYCNIPVNQNFTCGESEYRCQYRCTVNSKCNLYSVRRIHSSCYRCVFHICTNETVGCQGHLETNCSDWKTYIKDGSELNLEWGTLAMGLFAAIILLVATGCICKSRLNKKRAEREAAVTPTGYPLGVPGLHETSITQDHEINSIEIVSQQENKMENSLSVKLRQFSNKEDSRIIMQIKKDLICPDCNSSFDMGFHKPVLLLDCGHSVCRKCSNGHAFVYCPVKGCRKSSLTADNIILSNVLEAQSDCDLIKTMECPVCFDFYDLLSKSPKILSCAHTLCSTCLGKLKEAKCPHCRKKVIFKQENQIIKTILALNQMRIGVETSS